MPFPLIAMGALAGAKALGGALASRGADKMAEAGARNQNKAAKYDWRFKKADYGDERGWQKKKRNRSSAFRSQLLAGLMANPKYGLAKLFPGFAKLESAYNPQAVVNPYEAAGPPPEMEAQKGGFGAAMGNAIGGAAGTVGQLLPYTKWGQGA